MRSASLSPRAPSRTLRGIRPLLVAAAVVALAAPAQGQLIVNGSFESGPDPGERMQMPSASTAITGWVVNGSPVDYVGTYWNAAEGARSLALNGTTPGSIAQTFDTVPGGDYTVLFHMAGDAFSNPVFKHVRVAAAGQSQDYEFDATHAWPWGMGWLEKSFMFTAAGASTTLEFASLDAGDTGPVVDNVVVLGPSPVGVEGERQSGLELARPYPNPSRDGTVVSYTVPVATSVRVVVSDIRGREVRVLAEGVHAAGPHTRVWDGRAAGRMAPPGVYFIQLVTPGATLVEKAIRIP